MAYLDDSKSNATVTDAARAKRRRALQRYFEEQDVEIANSDMKSAAAQAPLAPGSRRSLKRALTKPQNEQEIVVKKLRSNVEMAKERKTATERVFENPDLKRLVMANLDTPFCEESTNKGKRCARAWVYKDRGPATERKASRYAPERPAQLNCSQY